MFKNAENISESGELGWEVGEGRVKKVGIINGIIDEIMDEIIEIINGIINEIIEIINEIINKNNLLCVDLPRSSKIH